MFEFQTDAQLCEEDLLWSAASIESSLAGLRAEQFQYLRDFLLTYARDTQVVGLVGRERLVRYGGAGTPEVPEFALAQVRAEMGLSPWAAQALAADALSLIYRRPKVFAVMCEGEVDEYRTRMAASATRELSLEQVARVDERLAAGAPVGGALITRMSRKRLNDLVEQVVGVEDPASAADQVAAALADRDVTIRPGGTGVSDLSGSVSDADGVRLSGRLAELVGWMRELGDDRPKSVLRSVGLGMLADPGSIDRLYERVRAHRSCQQDRDARDSNSGDSSGNSANSDSSGDDASDDSAAAAPSCPSPRPAPATVLYVHFDRESGTWSLDGSGPLTQTEAVDLVGHSSVTLTPVIDLAENLTYTGYVAAPKLKEQLRLMNAGLCIFPYCDKPAWDGDYDHLTNYDPNAPPGTPGATDSRNGGRTCRHDHRVKTHTDWKVQSPASGSWLWRGPRGDHYLVTAGTTTRLHT